jgi:cyclic pyranopterin monophosphate synthase
MPRADQVLGCVDILHHPCCQPGSMREAQAIKHGVNRCVHHGDAGEHCSQRISPISSAQALQEALGINGNDGISISRRQSLNETVGCASDKGQVAGKHDDHIASDVLHARGDGGDRARALGEFAGPRHMCCHTLTNGADDDHPGGAVARGDDAIKDAVAPDVGVKFVGSLHSRGSASRQDQDVECRHSHTYAGVMSADSPADGLSHIDQYGRARMVDVSPKDITVRTATASGFVRTTPEVVALVREGAAAKGDVVGVARLAGLMGAKRTADLIPLCHPVALHSVDVDIEVVDEGFRVRAMTRTADRTGVEMEALTAVAVAGLTVIDMIKAVDPAATLEDIRVDTKEGGRRGTWTREA